LVRDGAHLADILDRDREAGIRELFVVGGNVDAPAGGFPGADALLAAMSEMGHHPEEIGITGYPESHPLIEDDVTIQAMWESDATPRTSSARSASAPRPSASGCAESGGAALICPSTWGCPGWSTRRS
jgi:methylenetetrahydrofolate reductase (NADPH)